MQSNTFKTFSFAIVMCLVCGFLLTLTAVGLKERQEANQLIDKQKNILRALSLLDETKKVSGKEVESLYKDNVKALFVNSNGELEKQASNKNFPLFLVEKKGKVTSYAIPFEAYGLWSWIKGYIGMEGDGETICGFTVYSHAETPGLGGECEKPWFKNQFKNQKITNQKGDFVSITVVKGKARPDNKNEVDGMSGATITGKGIEKYLKEDLKKYESFAKRLRNG
ncbi:NADH:ubiquinone oxidoreductase subunit C [Candidatus Marinamargulisbacteria bacterium SCGC AG-410-N11]|nr:NADH:ubiquinone oxidoreductase subunit C [Candidatus Marinamargulisbacteria bacterium SCGC AG-410-N11]